VPRASERDTILIALLQPLFFRIIGTTARNEPRAKRKSMSTIPYPRWFFRFSRTPGERLVGAKLRRIGRSRMLLKAALWAAGLVTLFALLGFFVVPPVAKHYMVKNLSALLGRQVTIQDIDVNPFTMTAAVHGFTVKEPDGSEVFASFEELFVDLQAESIVRRAPILDDIRLQRPYVHVERRDDGSYNFSDLVKKFAAKRSPQSEDQGQTFFSLNNIQIFAGRLRFDDRPKRAEHAVTDINLAIPFISNLPYLADRYVQPSFSAKVNDTPFAINGRTKPFKESLETEVELDIYSLEVPRYMEYVPAQLPFKISSGQLEVRMTATFSRTPNRGPSLSLAGKVGLEKFSMSQTDGRALAGIDRLALPVVSAVVFAREVKLGNVLVENPEVFVRRERDGNLNWLNLVREASAQSGEKSVPSPEAEPPRPGSGGSPWKLEIARFEIKQGKLHFADETTPKPFQTDAENLRLVVQKIAYPQREPAAVELGFDTRWGESITAASVLFITPLHVDGSIDITGLQPRNYAPYFAQSVGFDVREGTLNVSTRFKAAQAEQETSATLSGLNASVDQLRLRKRGASEDFLVLPALALKGLDLDLDRRSLQVTDVTSRGGRLHAIRDRDGTIDLSRLTRNEQSAGQASSSAAKGKESGAWQWLVKRIALERYAVTFDDRMPPQGVTHDIGPIKLNLEDLSNRRNSTARVALETGVNKTGEVIASGPVGMDPPRAQLSLDVRSLDLVPLQPYFEDKLNILVTSGEALVHGLLEVRSQGGSPLAVAFKGDAGVNDFASVDKLKAEDFLKWRSLFVAGIDAVSLPFALHIRDVALADFYSRLIIYPDGRLNVQGIVADGASAQRPGQAQSDEHAPAQRPARRAGGEPRAAPSEAQNAAPAPVTIGKISLQGGDVNFTDLFIKPNYSADLSQIGGSVTGLSSQLDTTADVELRGRFAQSAPVQIDGKLNPLLKNLFLDIKANVRDIELGPFTPYSGKYVGYAIQKGKMSFDVAYRIEDRKLSARNRLTLNQLTFGDRIESPTATKLPVLLAVALLQDRNGVIDVNLPISGSLDDPKFSIGGIILQIVFNLIEKAVTSPFALIGSLFGGQGEELAYVRFEPGRAALAPGAEDKLDKLQKALIERPALKLDVTGRADPDRDREGLRRYRFDQQVKAQKLKELVKKGASVPSLDEVKVEPQEYETYLKRAYKESKLPKPRNLIGLPKDLPRDEMEKLMLTDLHVTDDDLVQLANQRAQVAKDVITRAGKVPVERVFLLAPKVETQKGEQESASSRVDFALK
jgi:Domain of Unknown Function (DUF748)